MLWRHMFDVRLEVIADELPLGFDEMRTEARAEDYNFLERLATDWTARTIRFDQSGEALIAAYSSGVLAGIGGITHRSCCPGRTPHAPLLRAPAVPQRRHRSPDREDIAGERPPTYQDGHCQPRRAK